MNSTVTTLAAAPAMDPVKRPMPEASSRMRVPS